jgi:hypothetical protein
MCHGRSNFVTAYATGGTGQYTFSWHSKNNPSAIAQPAPNPIFTDTFAFYFSASENTNITCWGKNNQHSVSSYTGYCFLFLLFDVSTPNISIIGCSTCLLTNQVIILV